MTENAAKVPVWGAPNDPGELGELIALLRRRRGLTQAGLADSADVTRRFVNELEGGHSTMYVRRLFAVLESLGARLVITEVGVSAVGGAGAPEVAQSTAGGNSGVIPREAEPQLRDLGW